MQKLSREENILLRVQGLYFFTDALAGVFINIFIFTLGGFRSAVLYNFVAISGLLFWYMISGWELKIFSSRTLVRFGLFCKAVNYGLLFLLRANALPYLIPLGIIAGTGIGHFWSGFNLTQYNLTRQESRSKYFGWFGSLVSLAQSFGPIIAGGIITAAAIFSYSKILGYAVLFLIIFLLTVVNAFCVGKLPAYNRAEYSFAHLVRHRRTRNWYLVLLQQFCIGLWDVSFVLVSGILLYLIVKGELGVGMVNSVSALLYTGVSLWAGRVLGQRHRLPLIGMVGMPLGILLFALQQNWLGVLALILATGIAGPFLYIPPLVAFFNTVDETQDSWQKKYHLFIEREAALDIPRVLAYLVLFLLLAAGNPVQVARYWMMAIAVIPVGIVGISLAISRRQNRPLPAPIPIEVAQGS